VIIGNNKSALEAAAEKSKELGHFPIIISDSISGDVSKVSDFYVRLSKFDFSNSFLADFAATCPFPVFPFPTLDSSVESVIFIAGGEPTVVVRGSGKGGRNQELALRVGSQLPCGACFLSAGTDGLDGPTDAAGAVFDKESVQSDLDSYLNNNDSYTYLDEVCGGRDLIRTGHTGTNVMDVHLLMVHK
jgi:glycerate 2-kinase